MPTLPSHPTQTPAPSFAGQAPTSDPKETTVARRGGYAERYARRLEDLLAELGTHLERAQKRQRIYTALETLAAEEINDYETLLADLRQRRAERVPGGLAVAS